MNLTEITKALDSFLDTKVAPQKPLVKGGVAALLLLLPTALFFFLLYSPNLEKITALESDEKTLRAEIATLKKKTKHIEKFREEKRESAEKFMALTLLLPKQKEIPSLLTNISGLGTASGLDFLSFRPKGETGKEFYAEIPVDIKVSGHYHNLGVFLDKVSKLPRIVTIRDLKVGSPRRLDNEMELTTSFELVTYRFTESSGAATPADGKGKKP